MAVAELVEVGEIVVPWTERIFRLPAALAAKHTRRDTDAHEELTAHVAYHMVTLSKSWRPGGMNFQRYLYHYLQGVAAQGAGTLLPVRKNSRRKELRHRAVKRLGRVGGDTLVDTSGEPGSALEDEEFVRALLRELPPRRREIVERYFFAGESMAEVGAAVGLSRPRVGALLAESLAEMRRLAGELGVE